MLLAVHISDNILANSWSLGGMALTAVLFYVGSRRLQDEEIPRIALMTAAFFITSLVHIKVPPTSVHLLLNGLVGVLLGFRALLAIPIGLFLQALFMQHGGFTSLGVNACILAIPAVLAFLLFKGMNRIPWKRRPWFRSFLVAVSCLFWLQSLIYSIALFRNNSFGTATALDLDEANSLLQGPWTWLACGAVSLVVVVIERRVETAPEFPLGLLIGVLAVVLTLGLNYLVLSAGSALGAEIPPLVWVTWLVAHLPIAVIEGVVLGFTVGFLAKVKPEMLGLSSEPRP